MRSAKRSRETDMSKIVAIRPGYGHIEFDGQGFWLVELGFEAIHASSSFSMTYENAKRWLKEM